MSLTAERFLWLFAVFSLIISNHSSPNVQRSTANCDGLKAKSQMNNFSIDNLSVSDNHLTICVNNGSTCCSQKTEQHLHKVSVENLQILRAAKTDLIKKIFNEGRIKFDDFFGDVINESEKKLDKTFMGIYKSAYANNTHITRAFYSNLRKFYFDGKSNPRDIIKEFFQEILKKIFVLINGPVSSLDCIGKTLNKVSPFGDVPRRLTIQVERSFVAARTFVHGMKYGKFVVDRLTDRKLPKECLSSVTKMTQCSLCVGHNNIKPCAAYCERVFGECLGFLMALENVWDEYLKQMQNLAIKLEGPYDIDAVAGDMAFEISDGIMHFQRENIALSAKIKSFCPQSKRQTRSLTSSDTSDFFLENDKTRRGTNRANKLTKGSSSALVSLTKPYREHFEKLKLFWSKLSKALCDETVVADNDTDKYCWSGLKLINNTELAQYPQEVFPVNNGQNDVEIRMLTAKLNTVIKNLKAAASGNNVPGDGDIPGEETSGSGSGSGSGFSSGGNPDESEKETPEPDTEDVNTTTCINCIPNDDNVPVLASGNNTAGVFYVSYLMLTATCLLHFAL